MNLGNLMIGIDLFHWRFGRMAEYNSSLYKTIRCYYGPFYYVRTVNR